ncbi:MAG: hypothetical protein K2G11_01275 [Muribaculaceae bacterium]|nr:hypothetical protein [Muribaculaceae bacterium]
MKNDIRNTIMGVIGSLIASGIVYFFTKERLWNYNIPVWLWLSITIGVYLIYKLSKYLIFWSRLKGILSEFKEGNMGDSFPYTWEYKKSKGPYSVYGYEPYNFKVTDETKVMLSEPNVQIFSGHYVPEYVLKRYIQLQIVYKMNKKLQPFLIESLKFLDYAQDAHKHTVLD